MHCGQGMQNHALHFFYLSAPKSLFSFGSDHTKRNIFEVTRQNPKLGLRAVQMHKFGQEIIEATAGWKIHGTGAIPGGINRNLHIATCDRLLGQVDQMLDWSQNALTIARSYVETHADRVAGFGTFPFNHMALTAPDGALDLYHGQMRAVDPDGKAIFDHLDFNDYHKVLVEDVRAWSYMTFPCITAPGPDVGWHRVGLLARMNVASHIDTPLANAAHIALREFSGGLNHSTLGNHWARMIEVVPCVENIRDLLHDPALQGTDLVANGTRRPEGIRAVRAVAVQHLSGQAKITEGLLNHVKVAIRAYDPCLSCATHALGSHQVAPQAWTLAISGDAFGEVAKRLGPRAAANLAVAVPFLCNWITYHQNHRPTARG